MTKIVHVKSIEFMQGYEACAQDLSRTRNPYFAKGEFPSSSTEARDWNEGWNTRFHGENIYEGTPDP